MTGRPTRRLGSNLRANLLPIQSAVDWKGDTLLFERVSCNLFGRHHSVPSEETVASSWWWHLD
jgi:hypothetical protein